MPLHISLRPSSLEEVYGNDSIKTSLASIFARKSDFPHAYLFTGPSGCGKTTFGRIIASLLKCGPDDLFEYNTANMRGIDTVREIDQNCRYAPSSGSVKVYILDEVHRTTVDFQNSLLKLLEDAPSHVFFILCTTEPEKLLKTIHTRCSTYQVHPLLNNTMKQFLNDVVVGEGIDDFSGKVIDKIIQASEGSPRQALVILDQVIDITDEQEAVEAVSSFIADDIKELKEVFQILLETKSTGKWDRIRATIKEIDLEPEKVRRSTLGYLGAVLLNRSSDDRVAELLGCFTDSWFYLGKSGMIRSFYYACKI